MASLSLFKMFFFLIAIVTCYPSPSAAQKKCGISSVYQFGDSIADTGNAIRIQGGSCSSGRPPYGETFFKKPTGRYSDGRVINDFIVSALSLPFLNPYLDKGNNFSQGVNFAFGGATALSNAFWALQNVTLPAWNQHLNIQLGWFKSYLRSIGSGSNCLNNSLVIMGEIGGVDYYHCQLRNIPRPTRFVPNVIDAIMRGIRDVIQLGATRILVPGVTPSGCLPINLARYQVSDPKAYDQSGCLIDQNDFSSFHNDELNKGLKILQREFPNVRIVYGDYYGAFMTVLRSSASLGFNQNTLLLACCGGGGTQCGAVGSTACANPSQYISWDGVHLTDEAHHRMADILINDMLIKFGCNDVHDSGLLLSTY